MSRRISAVVVVLGMAVSNCGLPAFDAGDYRSKAVDAVEEAISQAQTAILTAELARRNRTFGASIVVQLEDAEEEAAGATEDFAAVLPPDDRSAALRRVLLPMLEQTSDLLSRMRFAARHGEIARLRLLAAALAAPLRRLERWVEPPFA